MTRSAGELLRAQSAITRAVRDIEDTLGVALFERTARGMLPTSYGKAVVFRVERANRELTTGQQELLSLHRAERQSANGHQFVNERRLQMLVDLAEHRDEAVVSGLHGVTQPAVSLAVRELESQLKTRLFERTARGLTPTAACQKLAYHVRLALSELRVIPAEVAVMRGSMEGTVVVGALPLARTTLLPSAIARLLAHHPKLKFRTVESPFEALQNALRAGELDLIVGALRPVEPGSDLRTEALFQQPLSIIVRRGHPLAQRQPIDAVALLSTPWVMSRLGSPARKLLADAFDNLGLPVPDPAVETCDLTVLRGLLLESDMITAMSPQQLGFEIDEGKLTVLDFPLPDTIRDTGIIQRANAVPSPATLLLIEELRRFSIERMALPTPAKN